MNQSLKTKTSEKELAVVISGMPSVGKTTAAKTVAKKFGLVELAGGDMLKQIAIDQGYSPLGNQWWDSKEGMRFLSHRRGNQKFDKSVDRRLIEKIKQGGVVVTSYPIPWICKKGLKIWFSASQKTRAKRLAGRDSISLPLALRIVKKRDRENKILYRQLYGIEFGKDLSVFNYKIDTEKISAREVARVCVMLVEIYKREISREN